MPFRKFPEGRRGRSGGYDNIYPCQSLVVRRPGRRHYALTEGWTVLAGIRDLLHRARARQRPAEALIAAGR